MYAYTFTCNVGMDRFNEIRVFRISILKDFCSGDNPLRDILEQREELTTFLPDEIVDVALGVFVSVKRKEKISRPSRDTRKMRT